MNLLDYRPLIIHAIEKYAKDLEFEDCLQEGYISVMESIRDFDSSRKIPLNAYISTNLRYLYLSMERDNSLSLNDKDSLGREYLERLESEEETEGILRDREKTRLLKEYLNSLGSRQREILLLSFLDGESNQNIADKLGLSYQTVANSKLLAKKNLLALVKKAP